MPEITSPTVWRRWLALELTRLRREAGLTQKEVAKALRCTIAKVSYVEGASRTVVLRDLDEILLPLYRVPEEEWPKYIQAAKDSRQLGWWEQYDSGPVVSWFSLFVGLEQGASTLDAHCTGLVHGLTQTADYVEAVIRNEPISPGEAEIAARIKLRLSRQEVLHRKRGALRFWLTLDEAALRRVVGSPAIMADQLWHLAELARQPNITVQIIPNEAGAYVGALNSFSILGFPFKSDPGVVYAEHRGGALYLEEADQIVAHRTGFNQIRSLALSPDDSATMLREIAKDYQESR
jgi:transcriptional regulator with XRE-family HTH domain